MLRRQLDVTIGSQDEEPHLAQLAGEEPQVADGRRVRRLQIVEDHEDPPFSCGAAQERGGRVEELEASPIRILPRGRREVTEQVAQLGEHLRNIAGAAAHLATHHLRLGVANVRAQHLDPRPVGRRSSILPAATPENEVAPLAGARGELIGKPALPDAGFTAQQEEAPAALLRLVESRQQLSELGVSSKEGADRLLPGHDFTALVWYAISPKGEGYAVHASPLRANGNDAGHRGWRRLAGSRSVVVRYEVARRPAVADLLIDGRHQEPDRPAVDRLAGCFQPRGLVRCADGREPSIGHVGSIDGRWDGGLDLLGQQHTPAPIATATITRPMSVTMNRPRRMIRGSAGSATGAARDFWN